MHPDNNMPRRTLKGFEFHTKHKPYKDNLKKAKENIKTILDSNYQPHIEYSGGKDSLVLLHLIMQEDDTIPIYNFHPGYGRVSKQLYRSLKTHNELIKSAQIAGAKDLTVINTPFSRPNYWLNNGDYFKFLKQFMQDKNTDLRVIGVRADESVTRKHRCKGNMIRKECGNNVALPLRDLTTTDIWSYIVTRDLYYISHYDEYGPVYGWDKVRFTSHFNENELELGGSYYFDKLIRYDEYNKELTPDNATDWIIGLKNGEPVYYRR